MAKLNSQNSLRGACYGNEVSRSALQFLNGANVGTAWFVDGTSGVDTAGGKTWSAALKTITKAVALCAAGDTIFIKGTAFDEAVTCSKAGVSFVGVGTGPAQATWTHVSATTVTTDLFCLKIAAASVLVENIKFRPVAYIDAGLPTGIYLDEGSDYSIIRGCRFQGRAGSYSAIYGLHPVGNIVVENNEFIYMNTATYGAAIYMPAHTGIACSAWIIRNNIFNSCVTAINIDGRTCVIEDNIFMVHGLAADNSYGAVTTLCIDLSGTDTFGNVVTGNLMGGAYTATLYIDGAGTDLWYGNWCAATATTAPDGHSILVPA
jgi:hypothetical protein